MDDEEVVSGDYDNATNMMIGSYTRVCVQAIVDKLQLSKDYGEVAVRSLCDCLVHLDYKDPLGKKCSLQGFQKEAQPMGKILSFTVLCLINFAVCRKALELDRGITIPIARFPGLINGDDCCFPIKVFNHWVGCSAMVGLFNSIGKTFKSRKFVEMNSRTFLITGFQDPGINGASGVFRDLKFKEVPFINFGLMKGMVRSAGCEDVINDEKRAVVEATSRMGWCHKELIKGFEPFHSELDYLFKYYHNKYLLSDLLTGIPYYVPFWLGGLGLSVGHHPEKYITPIQLKTCKWIYQNYSQLKVKSVCLEKTCLINSLIEKETSRIFKKYDVKDIDNFQILETQDGQFDLDLSQENQKVYNDMVEYVWRTRDLDHFFVQLTDNFIQVSNGISSQKLLHNSNIWRHGYLMTQRSKTLEELPWYQVWHRKQMQVKPIISSDASRDNILYCQEVMV
nr:RNA-dependent RNA polymerase [Flumine narna-like virus 30]